MLLMNELSSCAQMAWMAFLPIVSGYEFITLAVAFVLLWLGVVLRGF